MVGLRSLNAALHLQVPDSMTLCAKSSIRERVALDDDFAEYCWVKKVEGKRWMS